MSFIKIKDPRKREELIKDLIETRKRIKDNFIARKVGEIEYQTGLTKLFKPVIETQKTTAKEITEAQKAATEKITQGLLPIKEALENPIILPSIEVGQSIPAIKLTEKEKTELGGLAADALQETHGRQATQSDIIPVDAKKGLYKIGKIQVRIANNDLYIGNATEPIKGTVGLWKLLSSQGISDKKDYKKEDLINYIIIMHVTKATYDKNNKRISGNDKMNKLIKPFVKAIEKGGGVKLSEEINKNFPEETDKETDEEGDAYSLFDDDTSGTEPSYKASGYGLILPSDPNALIDRFDLLFSSKKAGHTGVRNEIVSILDELKRQGVIKTNEYKKLNSLIKK